MNNTIRVFYEDAYIKRLSAKIIAVEERENKYYVVLDRTIFFPGGGGQCTDKGYINNVQIVDIIEEGNIIYHITDEKIESSNEAICVIDYNRRLKGMHSHLGQHILSGCFFKISNKNTVGIHLGNDINYVDIVGEVTIDEIEEVEKYANKIISENKKVDILEVKRDKAKKMGLRRKLQTKDEIIRVVSIEELDINACCGVHPNSTSELQLIRISSFEKHKGNTRVFFKAGEDAVENILKRDKILKKVCNYLSCSYEEVLLTMENLTSNNKELREENSKVKSKLSEFEIKELIDTGEDYKNIKIISKIFEDENNKYLIKLVNKITLQDNIVVLFASKSENNINVIYGRSKNLVSLDMGSILKDSIVLIDGKGGGSKLIAQGAGKNKGNIISSIEYTIRRLKDLL